jgi:hypothetical protein
MSPIFSLSDNTPKNPNGGYIRTADKKTAVSDTAHIVSDI